MDKLKVGHTHGLNKVLEYLGDYYYLVQCLGCNSERRMWHHNVLRSLRGCRSCAQRNFKHPPVNDPATGKTSKEYTAWSSMIARCMVSMPSWKERYGETKYSELEIESSWLGPDGYSTFYADVGPAPMKAVYLDRLDNDRGYFKDNVRWATIAQSNTNKSNTMWLTAFGLTKCLSEWADDLGTSTTAIKNRLSLGWSVEDAVSKRPQGPRPTNDEYYIQIATRVAARGTCIRRAVGCVLVDTNHFILATAYNALPSEFPHCTEKPCSGAQGKPGQDLHLCQSRHAEELALFRCKDIYAIDTCYVTSSPCENCMMALLDTGCKRIVFLEEYPHNEAAKRLWQSIKGEGTWVHLPSP